MSQRKFAYSERWLYSAYCIMRLRKPPYNLERAHAMARIQEHKICTSPRG